MIRVINTQENKRNSHGNYIDVLWNYHIDVLSRQ